MRKISLSSHGLSYLEGCKGFNMISFVAGGNTYNLPNFIAFFLSPKLAISFMKGGMFNTITLQTQDYAGIFQKIVDLAFGKEVEIFDNEIQTLHNYATELENSELCNLLNGFSSLQYSSSSFQRKSILQTYSNPSISSNNVTFHKSALPLLRRPNNAPSALPPLNPSHSARTIINRNKTFQMLQPLQQNPPAEPQNMQIKAVPPPGTRVHIAPRHNVSHSSDRPKTPVVPETNNPASAWGCTVDQNAPVLILKNTQKPRRGAAKIGMAKIESSSCRGTEYEAENILSANIDKCFISLNEAGSWILVDFGNKFLIPSAYSIGGIASTDSYQPQNWALEVLHNEEWFTIDRQKDSPLTQGECRIIQINNEYPGHIFRLRQMGKNSSGSMFLALSTFELFGKLCYGTVE